MAVRSSSDSLNIPVMTKVPSLENQAWTLAIFLIVEEFGNQRWDN